MANVSVEELELLSFFEVEPRRLDRDVPWPYNEFSYQLDLGPHAISFIICPAEREISLSIAHTGTVFYALQALSLRDVRYHKDADLETLEIVISDGDTVWFRLRPTLLITQDAGEA